MKYTIFDPSYNDLSAGFGHQFHHFVCFNVFASQNNLIPVLNKRHIILTAGHNNGKSSILTNYIEVPSSCIWDIPEDMTKENTIVFDINNPPFKYQMKSYNQNEWFEMFPIKNIYKEIAQRIFSQLDTPMCCIRVRRGDLLDSYKSLAYSTSIGHIKQVISAIEKPFKCIYLMTDEKDKNYFNDLRIEYNLYQYFNIPELTLLKEEDNYALFCAEMCLRDFASIRISTCKTNNPYYDAYLDENFGVH